MESPPSWHDTPFRLPQGDHLMPLRQALEAAGYTQDAVSRMSRRQYRTAPLDLPAIGRRLAAPTPLNTLMCLFMLAQSVPIEAARRALAPAKPELLLEIGLLHRTATGVRATAMLVPFEGFFVAHDFLPDIIRTPLPEHCVLGIGSSTLTLAHLTVRRQGETMLDVGTGSGIHALLAARHAARVTATDLNPRALNFAALNMRLNGMTNITLRQGNLYEPVADSQFDLIVTNPPFVISPETRYTYRDSELPGDGISEQAVRGAPARLREAGYAVVLCNWYHQQGQAWADRPRQWVAASGCDAWIICFETEDPLSYASSWLRSTEEYDQDEHARRLDAWLRYYEDMGIAWINSGAVILRRRAARTNWIRADMVLYERGFGPCSAQIQRIFAAQDVLETLEHEQQLLDYPLQLTSEHQLHYELKAEHGDWRVREAVLKQGQGIEFPTRVDRLVASVVAGCDGRRRLRHLVAEVASGLGVSFDEVAPSCLRAIRQLMHMGYLSVAAEEAGEQGETCGLP